MRREKGSGSWDTVVKRGITYYRYRKLYPGMKYHKEFTGRTKADVKRKVQEFENKSVHVTDSELNKMTLEQCIENVLTELEPTMKTNNYATLRSTFRCYIKPYDIRDLQIGNVSPILIQQFYVELSEKYSESTVKKVRTLFNIVFNYLVDVTRTMSSNPASKAKLPHKSKYATHKKEASFLSLNEAKLFYNTCIMKATASTPGVKTGDYIYGRNALFCIIILYTGMRIGEAYALTWDDVNFEKNTISISKTKERIKVDDKWIWYVDEPKKTKSIRIIPLTAKAKEAFESLKNMSPGNTANKSDYIFVTQNNIPPSQSTLTRSLHAILTRAGIDSNGFGLHDLRHSFGSMLLQNGWDKGKPVDIKVISDILGHKDISTTYNIYMHILESHKSEVIKLLE